MLKIDPVHRVSRGRPQAVPDDNASMLRVGSYLEPYIVSLPLTRHALADCGSYFVSSFSTVGGDVNTSSFVFNISSLVDTSPILVMKNNSDISGSVRTYVDFVRIKVLAVDGSVTSILFAIKIDNIDRSPAASFLQAGQNTNMDSGIVNVTRTWIGAITGITASSNQARTICTAGLKPNNPSIGDEYFVKFGPTHLGGSLRESLANANGTFVSHAAPVVLGPQQTMTFYAIFLTAGTGPTLTCSAGWWER